MRKHSFIKNIHSWKKHSFKEDASLAYLALFLGSYMLQLEDSNWNLCGGNFLWNHCWHSGLNKIILPWNLSSPGLNKSFKRERKQGWMLGQYQSWAGAEKHIFTWWLLTDWRKDVDHTSYVVASPQLTRPDTRQSSRGRLGRSSNAKTDRNSKMWPTDGRTDRPTR